MNRAKHSRHQVKARLRRVAELGLVEAKDNNLRRHLTDLGVTPMKIQPKPPRGRFHPWNERWFVTKDELAAARVLEEIWRERWAQMLVAVEIVI